MPKKTTQQDKIPQARAALTLEYTIVDTEWTMDNGASNHMTGKSGMLTNIGKYSSADSMLVGDGPSMSILEIGDSYIKQKKSDLPLNSVLLVPNITKNLLSVNQLTKQFPINCEFSNVYFCVKEWKT